MDGWPVAVIRVLMGPDSYAVIHRLATTLFTEQKGGWGRESPTAFFVSIILGDVYDFRLYKKTKIGTANYLLKFNLRHHLLICQE